MKKGKTRKKWESVEIAGCKRMQMRKSGRVAALKAPGQLPGKNLNPRNKKGRGGKKKKRFLGKMESRGKRKFSCPTSSARRPGI